MTSKLAKPPTVALAALARGWNSITGSGETELVPQARLSGPMPWVIAIMVALTVIAAAGGLALRNVAAAASADLAGGITVQIVEAGAEARAAQAQAALAVIQAAPGVQSARIVPEAEVTALIAPWLGAEGADSDAVPIPALIDARLDGKVSAQRLEQLRSALRGPASSARVDAQSGWLAPVFGAIQSLQWLALALVAMLFLGRQFADLGAGLVAGGALGWLDWILLALIPFAGVALAMITARLSVLHALRRMV
jgi:cell division transport system permease protein